MTANPEISIHLRQWQVPLTRLTSSSLVYQWHTQRHQWAPTEHQWTPMEHLWAPESTRRAWTTAGMHLRSTRPAPLALFTWLCSVCFQSVVFDEWNSWGPVCKSSKVIYNNLGYNLYYLFVKEGHLMISMKLVIPLYFDSWKNSFSDISRKCILPNMIGAVIIFSKMHFLPI